MTEVVFLARKRPTRLVDTKFSLSKSGRPILAQTVEMESQ